MSEIPAEGYTAMGVAVQAYEPEAAWLLARSPGALLQVLLETGRRSAVAAAPLVRAAERERLFTAIRRKIPLSAPWRGEALDLIAEVWRETDG